MCTKRVCDAVLSLLFTLVDFGVLADRNKRRRMLETKDGETGQENKEEDNKAQEAAAAAEEEEAAAAATGDKKDMLSVHNTFMDVVVRSDTKSLKN